MAKNKNKTWHDHVSKTSAKTFMYLKQLAIPLGLAVVTAGLFLMFGPFLTPVALGIVGSTLIALMAGAATFILAKLVGRIIRGCIEKYCSSLTDAGRSAFHAGYVVAAVGVTAGIIALAATGVWAPAAVTTAGIIWATLGAGVGTALLLRETITVLQNFFNIFLNLIKPSATPVNNPANSLSASTTIIATQNPNSKLNNSYGNTSQLIGASTPSVTNKDPVKDACDSINASYQNIKASPLLKTTTGANDYNALCDAILNRVHKSPITTTVASASNDSTKNPESVFSNTPTI